MKGIIFDAESVRAILAGTKTQTRRVVKPQPPDDCGRIFGPEWYEPAVVDRHGEEIPGKPVYGIYDEYGYWGTRCPLQPGDVVYVRETIAGVWGCDAQYVADETRLVDVLGWDIWHVDKRQLPVKTISPIYMPEWASRIRLEIAHVRVERLQDISEADAMAEGLIAWTRNDGGRVHYGVQLADVWETNPCKTFARRWEAINAKRGYAWETNPWVWVYEFVRAEL